MSMQDRVLDRGASIILRPRGWPSFKFEGGPKYQVAIEYKGLRNGYRGDDLDVIWDRALDWMSDVDFYEGIQWTAADVASMEAAKAS